MLSDPGGGGRGGGGEKGGEGGREASNTFWCLDNFRLILSFDGTYWVAARCETETL